MTPIPLRSTAVLAALALAVPLAARGADGPPPNWTWQDDAVSVPFLVDAESLPSSIGGAALVEDAVRSAVRTWNIEGDASVHLDYGGTTTTNPFGADDGVNVLIAGTNSTSNAVVWVGWTQDGTDDTRMVDCDMQVFTDNLASTVPWSAAAAGAEPGELDLELGVLHLLGRCLGLETSLTPGDVMNDSLPLGTGPAERTLSDADITALQTLYGESQVSLVHYAHAVIYDVDDEEGDRRGAPGEQALVRVQVDNEGDAAYDLTATMSYLSGTATLSIPTEVQEAGDLLHGEQGQFLWMVDIVDCVPNANATTFTLDLTDARGDTSQVSFDTWIQCFDPNQLDDEEPEDEKKCGCATSSGLGAWPVLLLAPVLSLTRRRRGSPPVVR